MTRLASCWLLGAGLLFIGAGASAQETAKSKSKSSEPEKKSADSPSDILAEMKASLTLDPEDNTPEGIRKAFIAASSKVIGLADKLLAHKDVTEKQKEDAFGYKIGMLSQGAGLQIPGYADRLKELADELVKDLPKSELASFASFQSIQASHQGPTGLEMSALPAIEKFIEDFPGELGGLRLLSELAMSAEQADKPEDCKKIFAVIQKAFPDHEFTKMVPGILRRLELVGKPLELKGTTLDGKPIDIGDLKGKVVLVDFWATWCGPCVAEFPYLKKAYEAYRADGFEIVGINLDDDVATLEGFLKDDPLPWTQIVSRDKESAGFSSQWARHYGISAIPTMFLVDKTGKVVSTTIRGHLLKEELPMLLGVPSKEPKEDTAKEE